MTVYVFDSGPLIILFRHYYPRRFPTLWEQFDQMVANGQITSTREVMNELEGQEDDLANWCKQNRRVFATPTVEELTSVREIFNIEHFQAMIRKKERLQGKPVADPFVIARARCLTDSCVVTSENHNPNAAKVPNVCEHFKIDYTDLEGFMERENWRF
ncbi:conserved hypothetical protein [Nitrosomonas nitrosa]|uniref:DUF4411 domain-containing protein n=1 Tax=Nitrosomonas nitrosa TaxID=52442 RepID=A0A8H8Z0S1_9PROT|nr:PIN domain-containing protein [Nitrosomonas nitrosa]CAE6505604.1 conserved hypothetical protein [Nitrosomonas nitrosa]